MYEHYMIIKAAYAPLNDENDPVKQEVFDKDIQINTNRNIKFLFTE